MSTSSPSSAVLPFFREELMSEDISAIERVANIHRINLIASALKPDIVRKDVIALLEECLDRFADEDEFLFALAEELPLLTSFLGGEQHYHLVVPLLHALASVEETVVRQQSASSLAKIIESIELIENRIAFVQEDIIPVFDKLLKASWFTSRVSACQLFPIAYKYSSESRRVELRKSYAAMCHDDTPMVRRAAAEKLMEIFEVAEPNDIISHFVNTVYQYFWNEQTQEAILCSAVEATTVLAKKLAVEANQTIVAPRIAAAAKDNSWRVRLTLANSMDDIVKAYAVSDPQQNKTMAGVMVSLLQDPEQEVRTAALTHFAKCVKFLPPDLIESQIIPIFARLTLDSSQSVRAALATAVTKTPAVVGLAVTQQHLFSLMEQLMKDEFHEVRLNVVKNAGEIIAVSGAESVSKPLLGAIQLLIQDSQWRVRLAVVNQIPQLAKHFGVALFTTSLEPLFLAALTDNVYAVRECTMQNATTLIDLYGASWMKSSFLPRILEHGAGTSNVRDAFPPKDAPVPIPVLTNGRGKPVSYLSRITVLQTLLHLAAASSMSATTVEESLMPIILTAMKDYVPNVRFAAIKAAATLAARNNVTAEFFDSQVKPVLKELQKDQDLDVRYFAKHAKAQPIGVR